jgi:hypothetical protein
LRHARKLHTEGASREVIDDLADSRDDRIAEAATDYRNADDPFDADINGNLTRAIQDLVSACQAPGRSDGDPVDRVTGWLAAGLGDCSSVSDSSVIR